jgi:micrococcal nuclease
MYEYKVKEVIKVVDGDTVDVVIDLGFYLSIKKRVRLLGINAPESRTRDLSEKKKGLEAKARLKEMCESDLVLQCHGLGKYGRVLGEFFVDGKSLNKLLVAEGHAVEYFGGKR